ncbi:MAG: hypothetical protein ACLRPT_00065 [Akkermansia muciniphila]
MGGGHWITKPDYDRKLLAALIRRIRERYGVEVWLEPGEAAAIHTGVLRCRVLDLFPRRVNHAILDVSASAHMPDTLEMPYRPDVFQIAGDASLRSAQQPRRTVGRESYALAGKAGEKLRTGWAPHVPGGRPARRLFLRGALAVGDELVFDDMAHYTMVKTTFFNGVRHPDIAVQRKTVPWRRCAVFL